MSNYYDTFIQVADDSPASVGTIPQPKSERTTAALVQYELLSENPYTYTQEELLFEVHARHKALNVNKRNRTELWASFFEKPQPCLRTSPLPKRYGWGIHFDAEGKAALYALESDAYERLTQAGGSGPTVLKAMRNKRS